MEKAKAIAIEATRTAAEICWAAGNNDASATGEWGERAKSALEILGLLKPEFLDEEIAVVEEAIETKDAERTGNFLWGIAETLDLEEEEPEQPFFAIERFEPKPRTGQNPNTRVGTGENHCFSVEWNEISGGIEVETHFNKATAMSQPGVEGWFIRQMWDVGQITMREYRSRRGHLALVGFGLDSEEVKNLVRETLIAWGEIEKDDADWAETQMDDGCDDNWRGIEFDDDVDF